MKRLVLLTGESSGDLYGSKLIEEILRLDPSIEIHAVCGPKMRQFPISIIMEMEQLQVMGFVDVFTSLPSLVKKFYFLRNRILDLDPDAVVFIDYPGLHLRLANALRKKNFQKPLIHYICPSVWAWGKKRIPFMEKNLDLLLSFFPFEKNCFTNAKARMQYVHVGHPLVQNIALNVETRGNILAIFPGSRKKEIDRNLPLFIQAAEVLKEIDPKLEIYVSISHENQRNQISQYTKNKTITLVDPDQNLHLMKSAKIAFATSGTVTLELALHQTPTIVGYALSKLDLFLAKNIFHINLPYYCIVNIIENKEVFPEFFGPNFILQNLVTAASKLLTDPTYYQWVKNETRNIRTTLGEKQAATVAAATILNKMSQQENLLSKRFEN